MKVQDQLPVYRTESRGAPPRESRWENQALGLVGANARQCGQVMVVGVDHEGDNDGGSAEQDAAAEEGAVCEKDLLVLPPSEVDFYVDADRDRS